MKAHTNQPAVAYCPPGTKFWFIWTRRGIRVQYGNDVPSVAVLPAPITLPHAPPYAPAVQAFTEACDAWLQDTNAVDRAIDQALRSLPPPAPGARPRCGRRGGTRHNDCRNHQERKHAMTTAEHVERRPDDRELPPAPLIEVHVGMDAGLRVQMDRCTGDVPLLEVIAGHARVTFCFDLGDVQGLGPEHVTLAEELATAACALRDEVCELVAAR